jgi:cell division transport system ATP-binding protein
MAVLERINAGGTTVLMATHEAGIVDQMKRRVIELVNGQIVRDERHGGYGYTAAIPMAAPVVQDQPIAAPPTASVPQAAPTFYEPVPTGGMTRPLVPTSQPQGPVNVPVVPQQPSSAQPVPAQPSVPEPATAPAGLQGPPPSGEALPDHLNFTANLDLRGLRADGEKSGEQNVGPTK